jgi:hypothetical protein
MKTPMDERRDFGRLNSNHANSNHALIATANPSASLTTITMKFFTIFLTAWFFAFLVFFLDPRKPGEFFLTYRC